MKWCEDNFGAIATDRIRTVTRPDGVTVYVDPGTRLTKKNRHRHIKEGTPKKLRGTQVSRLYDISGQEAKEW